MLTFEQDPTEKRKYKQTITDDTISSASWSITPAGPTLSDSAFVSGSTTVLVEGVADGSVYTLTVRITGASGQQYTQSVHIRGVLL